MSSSGWIGVDLDGTLALYDGWKGVGHIGAPVPEMLARVKAWRREGIAVRIFTARVAGHGLDIVGTNDTVDALGPIRAWCREHLGEELPITNVKDFSMVELWDDRAVQVEINTGATLRELLAECPLLHTSTCNAAERRWIARAKLTLPT